MRKIIILSIIVILIVVLTVLVYLNSNDIPANEPVEVQKESVVVSNQENNLENENVENNVENNVVENVPANAEYLDDFYGIYGTDNYEYIRVLPGMDDEHVNLVYFLYRAEGFEVPDFPISKSEDGSISGNMIITEKYEYNDSLVGAEANLLIENDNVKLSFNKNVLMFPQDSSKATTLEYKKSSKHILLKKSKEKALSEVVDSNGKTINKDVLTIVEDSENYYVFEIDDYIYYDDYRDILKDGVSISDMTKYYNYNKKDNKFVSLEDIAGSKMDGVNEYIKNEIEKMKEDWSKGIFNGSYEGEISGEWPYREFEGIRKVDYFENYFLVDEENQIVRIRVLEYPDEASRALGDICINVPFEYFENVV